MTDVAPELLERVKSSFTNKRNTDKILGKLYWKIQDGTATYKDASEYAERLGDLLAESLRQVISANDLPDGRMYYNIAERVLGTSLLDNYNLTADVAMAVQESMNRAAGIGLKAVRPELNTSRVQGILDKVSEAESFEDVSWVLDEPVVNFTMSVVEDCIRKNVDVQAKAGLSPKVTRIAEPGCCKWCSALQGKYEYPVDRDVYRRHERCRCIVLFDPGNGKVQNAHTKISYDSAAKAERDSRIARIKELESAKAREDFTRSIENRPELFSTYTPQEMKARLESLGYDVKPLGHGSLKGLSFEDGGGYRVNFGSDGLLQYHPATKSHHQGPYYKLSDGKNGVRWFNMQGDEIDVEASRKAGEQIIKHI